MESTAFGVRFDGDLDWKNSSRDSELKLTKNAKRLVVGYKR